MRQQRLPLFGPCELPAATSVSKPEPLRVAGLFAGIGGVEAGLGVAGHRSTFLCEVDKAAAAVLSSRFPDIELVGDVRDVMSLPKTDLLTAGFPCQDLSIAGRAVGISGDRSGLVRHVFRLLDDDNISPRWLLLENVPFLLQLHKGTGMAFLIDQLEKRGYAWAYRVVDTRAFGLPHRRQRILLLASKTCDPAPPLLGCDADGPALAPFDESAACGFYWTEGHRGIGWSVDCLPPIKVGSGLGIPSAPAVWKPKDGTIVQPHIHDLERLQGFDPGWTAAAEGVERPGARWRLVGNSVSVPLASWLGGRLCEITEYDRTRDWPLSERARWPDAAWGSGGKRFESSVSMWPISKQLPPLNDFMGHEATPISARAASGLLGRLTRYGAKVPNRFRADLSRLAATHTAPVYFA